MIINHPHLGPRDAAEFTILGDATLLKRPDWQADDADDAFYRYLYLRDNPAGLHRELWFHEQGDRSWLVVTRDTVTHEVVDVALARDVVLSSKTSKAPKASTAAKASKSASKANVTRADKKSRAKKLAKRSINKDQPR
tara:strand:- start:120 stop:533 length:414 start_codon:yes stop_codon:yes gene_type:complete